MRDGINFTKMSGTGNDFIVMDHRDGRYTEEELRQIARLACRRGIALGADGLLVLEKPRTSTDFTMRLFNSDGSEGEMCGNGARCIARYAFLKAIAKENMVFDTLAGCVEGKVEGREVLIRLNDPSRIELDKVVQLDQPINCDYIELGDPGVPHGIVRWEGLETVDSEKLIEVGRKLRYHRDFYKGANINFYDLRSNGTVFIRTYERGVEDLTLACGTGSSATAVALLMKKIVKGPRVDIMTCGGPLRVEVQELYPEVRGIYLGGAATWVAEGKLMPEVLQS